MITLWIKLKKEGRNTVVNLSTENVKIRSVLAVPSDNIVTPFIVHNGRPKTHSPAI